MKTGTHDPGGQIDFYTLANGPRTFFLLPKYNHA